MTPSPNTKKSAWVQLYEARRIPVEVIARSPGRPAAPIPRRKVGVTLSKGEVSEVNVWQERFSKILGRKVSVGETVGILTRISTARWNRLEDIKPQDLADLVEKMVG
jgi:hypothetical protein